MKILEKQILDTENAIIGYKKQLDLLTSLETNLENYNKSTVNKTFFEQFYAWKNDDGSIFTRFGGEIATEMCISKKSYPYGDKVLEIHRVNVDLENRLTLHVLAEVRKKIILVRKWLSDQEQQSKDLQNFDDELFIEDITKLYEKHGKPKYWRELLSSWETCRGIEKKYEKV